MAQQKRYIPIAREGAPFIWVVVGLTLLAWLSGWERVAGFLFLLTVFVVAFFRDPDRKIKAGSHDLLSPADGRVLMVEPVEDPPYLKGQWQKISIFMSVFNAHINRIPINGTVRQIRYKTGRFLMGFSEKASWENEHNAVLIEDSTGRQVMMVQVAGLIARRIICRLTEGTSVEVGSRMGMIRFGSRVDVYCSPQTEILVVPGDRVKAGLNVLARMPQNRSSKGAKA